MIKIRVWFMAVFQNYPFWRVTYKDGKRTFRLYEPEARGLAETFGGKLWIDYDYGKLWIKKQL